MAEHGDYLPGKEAALIDWLDNFVEKLQAHGTEWQIPPGEAAEVEALTTEFKVRRAKCAGPDRSKALVSEKDAVKEALIARVRTMVKFRFNNPIISDADRVSAGLHPRDRTRTPVPVPATRCLIADVKPLGGFRVEIRFQDEAAPESRAIPYGCNGALLNYAFGPEKEMDYDRLLHSALLTNNPWVLTLPPGAEGAFLSLACRWQNNKGELGPWSEIMYIAVS
ncbi:MAG: hypothetical protein LBG84_02695 [Treponema sp.]|jgi:hypothetical protein|nr:hypothetical protein [Treponema sp.]